MKQYYFNARWYDPGMGRFMSEDPVKDGINWYVYCSNNPLMFVDPSGLVYVPNDMSDATDDQISEYKFYHSREGSYSGTTGGHRLEPTPIPEHRQTNWDEVDLDLRGGFMHFDYKYWQQRFIENLETKIGDDYILGGGNMETYKKMPNKDKVGEWIGYDCSGGVMDSLRETTGIDLKMRNPAGIMNAPWIYQTKEKDIRPSDLIIVDVPKKQDGKVVMDESGNVDYGGINHVMTYIGASDNGKDLITTEGEGGDHRINPNSKSNTRYYKLENFKKASNRYFSGHSKFYYYSINWTWFINNPEGD